MELDCVPVFVTDIDWWGLCLETDVLLGRPVDGITAPKDDEDESDWECEWEGGVVWECESVAIAARYWMTFFVLSVFPAPDSPVIRMLWFSRSSPMFTQARSAMAKMCGELSPRL